MHAYIWIGRRDYGGGLKPYQINLVKKGWDPVKGWVTPLDTYCGYVINKELGIKLKPGEVRKLKLELI